MENLRKGVKTSWGSNKILTQQTLCDYVNKYVYNSPVVLHHYRDSIDD